MTDDELKALVASLSVAQQKTDEQMRRNSEEIAKYQKETEASLKRATDLLGNMGRNQGDIDEQMRRNGEEIAKYQKETEASLKRATDLLGNMGRNQGDIAEVFFFNSLVEDAHLGSIHFDDITRNDTKHRGKIQEEYDLFMTNGDAVGIIEVKYKAHKSDLDKLERKMSNFKKLYPKYEDCKIYGAIATFHINEDLKKHTLERGFFILQQRGELVHTECGENLKIM